MSNQASFAASGASVYSVQTRVGGNRTYALALREASRSRSDLDLVSVFDTDDRELWSRGLFQIATLKLPVSWVARRNADLRRLRGDHAYGVFVRRLLDRRTGGGASTDVVHLSCPAHASHSLRHARRGPTVITCDAPYCFTAPIELGPRFHWTARPTYAMERRAFGAATRSVFWSEAARRSAVDAYGLDADRTLAIHPGVDVRALRAPGRPPGPGRPRLLWIGNDFARKGGPELVRVFASEFADRAELHLVSNDPEATPSRSVHIHRGVSALSPEWFRLYREADLFVLPTRAEPFGLVYLEALSMGLPIVATRVNAVPEIVTHGETGLLAEPGDRADLAAQLRALIDDPALRARFGRAARQDALRRFDATTQFGRLFDLFVEVARSHASPRPERGHHDGPDGEATPP